MGYVVVGCRLDNDKSKEDRQKEEELLQQIHKLVETRDYLVDDVEFERLRVGLRHPLTVTNAGKVVSQLGIAHVHISTKTSHCAASKPWNVSRGRALTEGGVQSAQRRAISITDVSACVSEDWNSSCH
ncbi:hypothetical protein F2P81_026230 [Scophthalmus maximus]|uniref:BMERB domain-containing protein n=1 Tax=Scophthalmus maximus TaxID=52904 RepID=A0A6A4RN29_SCOMX|nr:hypothetical protein F2P81_026230 [Scophthalmus maximus]